MKACFHLYHLLKQVNKLILTIHISNNHQRSQPNGMLQANMSIIRVANGFGVTRHCCD